MRRIAIGLLLVSLYAIGQSQNCLFAQEQTLSSDAGAYEQAKALFDDGKYEEAIAKLDEVIEQNPDSKNAYLLRGTSYDYIGQYEQANTDYSRAIEIDPGFVAAYNNRGSAY